MRNKLVLFAGIAALAIISFYFYSSSSTQHGSTQTQTTLPSASTSSVTITSPSAGAVWTEGQTYKISWASQGYGAANPMVYAMVEIPGGYCAINGDSTPTVSLMSGSISVTPSETNCSPTGTHRIALFLGNPPAQGPGPVHVPVTYSPYITINPLPPPICSNGQLCISSVSFGEGPDGQRIDLTGTGFQSSSTIVLIRKAYAPKTFSPYPGSVNSAGTKMYFIPPTDFCSSTDGFCPTGTYSVQVLNGNSRSNIIPLITARG